MIELLVVISIAAVLAAVAVPALTAVTSSLRLSSASGELLSDLVRARSEAIKRNQRVLVCLPNAAASDCGAGTNWANGWWICYDGDADGSCDSAPSDGSDPNPLLQRGPTQGGLAITGSAPAIRFNPNGTQGAVGAAAATLVVSNAAGSSRTVSVAATGNVTKQ